MTGEITMEVEGVVDTTTGTTMVRGAAVDLWQM